jgi:hypothetical protein
VRKIFAAIATLGLLSSTIPLAAAAPNYAFPVTGCKYTYAKAHHNYPATDILTKIGCSFVAPTSGVIGRQIKALTVGDYLSR